MFVYITYYIYDYIWIFKKLCNIDVTDPCCTAQYNMNNKSVLFEMISLNCVHYFPIFDICRVVNYHPSPSMQELPRGQTYRNLLDIVWSMYLNTDLQ